LIRPVIQAKNKNLLTDDDDDNNKQQQQASSRVRKDDKGDVVINISA